SWPTPGSPGQQVTESIGNLTNGSNYTAQVRGCNEADQCGTWSPSSNQVTPFGPMSGPSASGSHSGCGTAGDKTGTVTFNWSGGSGNGREAKYQINVDNGGWQTKGVVPNGSSVTNTYNCNTTHTFQVRLIRTFDGQTTSAVSAPSQKLPQPPPAQPPRQVTVSHGANASSQSGCSSTCYFVHITMQNFSANTSYNCHLTTGHGDVRDYSERTNGSGSFSGDTGFYYGFHDAVTVNCGGTSGTKNPFV
ncbi:MAG TPA: hypothetical protein VH373_11720, partial [Jatrophihabitantaceae bacterium]